MSAERTKIDFSETTEAMRKDIRLMLTELAATEAAIRVTLSDDKNTLEKCTEKLAVQRAKTDMLQARLARRRADLADSVLADYKAAVARCEGLLGEANAEVRQCRDQWAALLKSNHSKNAYGRMKDDPVMQPAFLKDAVSRKAQITATMVKISSTLSAIDFARHAAKRAGGLTTPISGVWPVEADFLLAMKEMVPEVA